MNDRYLYRAKRKSDKRWIYGNLIHTDDGVYIIQNYVPQHLIGNYEVDPSTICQCTGKTDIEKNLIFEHDAVSFLDATSTEYGYSEHWQVGEALWDDETASFQVTERLLAESYEVLEDCKVLGNTIDNPELLEVGE